MDILFFAFANDPQHPLPNLRQEADELFRLLSPGEMRGDYLIVSDLYVTRQKIAYYLTQYKDQLKVFHYSGHAGRDMLQTNEESSQAVGVAHLLGQCPNLEFVFLNGCSTHGQVEDLWKQEIPAILATHSPVEDTKAAQFAIRFYQALSAQDDLQTAFELAKGDALTLPNAPEIRMYRDVVSFFDEPEAANWGLFVQPDLPSALNWRLPGAKPNTKTEESIRIENSNNVLIGNAFNADGNINISNS